jgi:hypothetical protein
MRGIAADGPAGSRVDRAKRADYPMGMSMLIE